MLTERIIRKGTVMKHTIEVCGKKLQYAVIGNGKRAFVMIPGMSLKSTLISEASVAAAYKALTEAYTIYLFDVRFDIEEGYCLEDYAEEIAEALQALSVKKATVFGYSMGGMAAQLLTIRHPELVQRLILVSTMCHTTPTAQAVIGYWHELAKAGETKALAENITDHVYSETTLAKYRRAILAMNRNISAEEMKRASCLTKALVSFDCRDGLRNISCPVLVVGSENDRVLGVEGPLEIAEALQCERHLYPGNYGHAVCDEATDFVDRITKFCMKYKD